MKSTRFLRGQTSIGNKTTSEGMVYCFIPRSQALKSVRVKFAENLWKVCR